MTHFPTFAPLKSNPLKKYMQFLRFPILPLSTEARPGDIWSRSLGTNFISLNPLQYESNYHLENLLITHFLLQLQIKKSQISALDQTENTNCMHSKYTYLPSKANSLSSTDYRRSKEYLSIPRVMPEDLELNPPPHSLDWHQKPKR